MAVSLCLERSVGPVPGELISHLCALRDVGVYGSLCMADEKVTVVCPPSVEQDEDECVTQTITTPST